MKKLVVALLALSGPALGAEPRWLNEKDLRYVFAGREVAGTYANGVAFSETYRGSGKIEYQDAENKYGGIWSVKGSTFCTQYGEHGGGCFRVVMQSENCFEFWLINEAEVVTEKSWIARGWRAKYPSTCPK